MQGFSLRPDRIDEACRVAVLAFERGHLPIADLLARDILAIDPGRAAIWSLLGRLAMGAALPDMAVTHFEAALRADPGFRPARKHLDSAQRAAPGPVHSGGDCYLVSKAWGSGFWSDVDHAVGCFLLAEMTGRTPVVHWGANSRYRAAPGSHDVFRRFFEPPGEMTVADLTSARHGVFPAKWKGESLEREGLNAREGPGSQVGAVAMLGRPESVVVCDFHVGVPEILPWLPPGHRFAGKEIVDVYRTVFQERLRPRPELAALIEAETERLFRGRPMVGVHVRATDKDTESRVAAGQAAELPVLVDTFLEEAPGAGVLVITDSHGALERYRARYGERVVATEAARTSGRFAVHLGGASATKNGHDLGVDILVDTCLAARCGWFAGAGASNVTNAVLHLKDWPPGRCVLSGEVLQHVLRIAKYPAIAEHAARLFW